VNQYTAVEEKDENAGEVFFNGPENGDQPLLAYDEFEPSSPEDNDCKPTAAVEEKPKQKFAGAAALPGRLRRSRDDSLPSTAIPNNLMSKPVAANKQEEAEDENDVFAKAPFKLPAPPAVLKRNRAPKKSVDEPLLENDKSPEDGFADPPVAPDSRSRNSFNPPVGVAAFWPPSDSFGDVPFRSMPPVLGGERKQNILAPCGPLEKLVPDSPLDSSLDSRGGPGETESLLKNKLRLAAEY
jgi:hypothetical protein